MTSFVDGTVQAVRGDVRCKNGVDSRQCRMLGWVWGDVSLSSVEKGELYTILASQHPSRLIDPPQLIRVKFPDSGMAKWCDHVVDSPTSPSVAILFLFIVRFTVHKIWLQYVSDP